MFALDAMKPVRFEWRTDLIAKWQPDAAEWRRYVGDRTQTPVCGSQAR